MSCDPRHGSFEAAGVTLLAAAVGDSCAAPTDPSSTPSGYCYTGLASSLNQSAVHPAGPLATCAAGFQCVPTSAASCASGECVPCSFGQYCPGHTSSPCGGLNHNICPAGRSCASPGVSEECAAGRYCAAGTFDGGKACPNIAYGRADLHDTSTYGFTIFCPNGSWAPAICSAGYICHNSSYREVCPAGYKCPEGANATQRCLADGFGSRSPESRCPAGSSAEGSKIDLVIVPVVILVLAWAIGHLAKLVVRLRRQRRRPVLPTKVKGLQLGQLSDGKNLLAEVVSGAIELQQRIRKAQRSRRLTPFVKQLRSASTAELIATRMRQTSSFERYSANDPPRHASLEASLSAQQRQLSRETSSVTSLDRGAHVRRLKFALRRTLARARTETSRGENFVSLQLSDVSFTIGKSCILSGLNADMEQGDLCALMGESGSGKTTLLNAISGRATYGQLSGDITLNGKPLVRGPNMGFVPQAYLVQKTLTVFENLWYSSMLRLPGISKDDRRSIVESVLTLLGLTACAHFSCDHENSKKKLSGGQLRRVGIGSELVTRPSILLLDEPTSALDAVNTRLVVDVLKNLCKRYGILIIASLHQPRFSVVNALDKVMVLRRGEFIYAGRQKDALGYFATHGFAPQPGENPADFYIEVAFGLATSTSKPPIEAEELAAHWNQRIKADRQAQLAARRSGKCSQVEFVAWCQVAKPTVGSDVRLELWQLIASIATMAQVDVTWELVYANVGGWQMSTRPLPGFFTQFRYCFTRYALSLWRKRSKYISTLSIMYGLGLLCGIMSGPEPASNTRITLLMLSIASFSVVSATVTLTSLGSDDIERACFEHEAAQGVRQIAEGLARMIADTILVLVPMVPMFLLPYAGMTATHADLWLLLWLFFNVGWSYTAFGYASAMFAGKGSAIAATAGSFVCAILLTGVIGAAPADVVSNPGLGRPWLSGSHWSCKSGSSRTCRSTDNDGGYGFFMLSPGMWAILAGGMLDATSLPFGAARIFVLSRFQSFGLIPGVGAYADIDAYERGDVDWYSASIVAMLIFGFLVRLISLIWFIIRHWDKKAMLRRLRERLRDGSQQTLLAKKLTETILKPQLQSSLLRSIKGPGTIPQRLSAMVRPGVEVQPGKAIPDAKSAHE